VTSLATETSALVGPGLTGVCRLNRTDVPRSLTVSIENTGTWPTFF